jgi:hypothetical protein
MGFFKDMFSNKESVSSKRVVGATCLLTYIGLLIGTFVGLDLADHQVTLMANLLYVGGALLGLGVLESKVR